MAGRQSRGLGWAGLCAVLLIGCQTLPSLAPCPMPLVEQASRIQEIVPAGTPREAAIAKLKKAGIEGNFSEGHSIFYCETWMQEDNERWHINVQVLFDETGQVYAYRPDPQSYAANGDEAGTVKLSKKSKEVAEGPKPSVDDPFAE